MVMDQKQEKVMLQNVYSKGQRHGNALVYPVILFLTSCILCITRWPLAFGHSVKELYFKHNYWFFFDPNSKTFLAITKPGFQYWLILQTC